ncbi:hypothetical protein [Evansella cellulosilytica]|uniref:Uncharacterized protein n=1 Tax=Evansella cellulosilytica (strain ATCC 21833 / DSM 2522 / FERM P-1141 / JCM 9156 / N-4) TaxID=649639 RepID=E6U223_EVAC2|nr:hypothetical protein [Evansella cellulosilytica]ADU29267.1 hypothetical protein Bcell_0994 [Evansella cellulosilytica DSM 2522]
MKEIKGVWKFLWLDLKRSLLIFWTILFSLIMFGIIISVTVPMDGFINWNTNIPVIIYLTIIGTHLFRNSLQYGAAFGSTRRHLYIGLTTFLLMMTIFNALVHNIFFFSVDALTANIDTMLVHSMLEYSNIEATFFLFTAADFAVFTLFMSLSFILSIVWHQLGTIPLYIVSAGFAFLVILPTFHPFWVELFNWYTTATFINLVGPLILIAVVLLLLPFPFVRRIHLFKREKVA